MQKAYFFNAIRYLDIRFWRERGYHKTEIIRSRAQTVIILLSDVVTISLTNLGHPNLTICRGPQPIRPTTLIICLEINILIY